MLFLVQNCCFSASSNSITIFIFQVLAFVINDGNTHPANGNTRDDSIDLNDGNNKHLVNSRRDSVNKNGKNLHENISSNSNPKIEDGNKNRPNNDSGRFDGNILRGDGYFAGKPGPNEAIGELDATESYAQLIKNLVTEEEDIYSTPRAKPTTRRTTPALVTLEHDCYYIAYYCLKGYKTGPVCGRTLYFQYNSFKNYCMLDYVNCMERYELWQIVHMGECINITTAADYQHYEYEDDFFLDQVYVIQE